MPRNRFVTLTDTVELPLSDGDTITVRRALSYGQSLDLLAAAYRPVPPLAGGAGNGAAPAPEFDAIHYPIAEMRAWLVGWSFRDAQGDTVPVSEQTVRALEPATANEITEAIRAHAAAQRADDPKAAAGAASTSP